MMGRAGLTISRRRVNGVLLIAPFLPCLQFVGSEVAVVVLFLQCQEFFAGGGGGCLP